MRVLYRRIIIFTFIFHVCCQNQDEGLQLRKSDEASLKILAIGNSFTEDGTAYLPALLNDKKLSHKVEMAQLIRGASSLAMHDEFYRNNAKEYSFRVSQQGRWQTVSSNFTMKAALIYNKWDIVILQQVSGYSGMYETWQPYLNNLVASIKADCLNPKVAIGWQMTWAYADNLTNIPQYSNSQSVMYQSIVNAVQKMQKEVNIAVVIPSGTAIQNLRQTSLNNPPLDITRDNSHIDLGAGRYTLACTWFEALIAPYFDISMQDNNVRTSEGNIPVNTDANAKLCQYAARYACEYPYQISVIQPTGALRQHVKTNL